MGDLSVVVRLNGSVVEDRVLPVRRLVRIGESEHAEVAFAGADVTVVRMGSRLALRGRTLEEGEEMHMSLGSVDVTVEHTLRSSTPSEWRGALDWRFAAAVVLVSAAGSWVDAADQWLDRLPTTSDTVMLTDFRDAVTALRHGTSSQRIAAVTPRSEPHAVVPATQEFADGPVHLPDDAQTGIGYYAWFKRYLEDDPRTYEAWERLALDPADPTARRGVARAAYDAGDFDASAWHYRALLEQFPEDRGARLRLAWAEKRRGHHEAEIAIYKELVEADPKDTAAIGGLAVALARMRRLDEAEQQIDALIALAPMDPRTDVAVATLDALQGLDHDALKALDRALAARGQLSEEMLIEMRRDIALDPAFASLRKNLRLRSLLHRQLGAASPRVLRPAR